MAREFKRSERVADLIQEVIGELLVHSIKDPRLEMVTVTGVKVSGDLRHATVYYTAHGTAERQTEALAGFQSAAGFLRSYLRKETALKFIPELRFRYDKSLDEGEKIDRLLREVHRGDDD